MKTKTDSTRRGFFWKAGAILSAPLAASGPGLAHGTDRDGADLQARLGKLEDTNAVWQLHQAYARHVNSGERERAAKLFADPARADVDESIVRLAADRFAQRDVIAVAPDGRSATAAIRCAVETLTPIEPSCTLVEMARQQGEGVVKRTELRVLETSCVKRGGVWLIERVELLPAATATRRDTNNGYMTKVQEP